MKKNAGWIIGTLLLGLVLWPRKKSETSGAVRIQLLDESGQVVAAQGARMGALTWNPFGTAGTGPSTQEGRSYTVRAIVTNRSTKDGLPVNVVFKVLHTVSVGGVSRLSKTQDVGPFAVGPVATFLPANADGTFALQVGDAGKAGEITVVVQAPTGAEVARATDTFTIGSSAPTYSATVTLTPIQSAENYLAQIAAATTRAEIDAIYTAASAATGRGEITSAQWLQIYDAINTRIYSGPSLANRPRDFTSVIAGR